MVYAPFFTRRRAFSEPWTNDRSWLFRLAYQTGHHLIGSEAQQVLAAREYLASLPSSIQSKIAVAGSRQGGMLALYSAAIEPGFAAAWIGSYFNERHRLPDEPEDRIIWNILPYGDAGLASLAAPCRLLLESRAAWRGTRVLPHLGYHAGSLKPGAARRRTRRRFGLHILQMKQLFGNPGNRPRSRGTNRKRAIQRMAGMVSKRRVSKASPHSKPPGSPTPVLSRTFRQWCSQSSTIISTDRPLSERQTDPSMHAPQGLR